MAEGINVRFSGPLKAFVENRSGKEGLYNSVSEYIRDLVRRDYEADETRRWDFLVSELEAGMQADESEFIETDMDAIISNAKRSQRKAP